jgi:cell fate (sporulation/competence/biofilm development) regulator YlbF (YheA/YmcA/DUF963 family)
MRRKNQETREEKLCRQIRNLTSALESEPTLRSLCKRKSELEALLRDMPLDRRLAPVPREETVREAKENISTYDEFIADLQHRLEEKRQAVQEVKAQIAELRVCRARMLRQTKVLG